MSKIEQIDCHTLKQWLDKNEAMVIDVREPQEYAAVRIRGATLVPVGTCSAQTVPAENAHKKIVFHCKAGVRSTRACEGCADSLPYETVYNLAGGLDAWIMAGYPVERG